MDTEIIKIAIADDEALFRAGISFILTRVKNFEIIFEAENGADLIEKLKTQPRPDVVLMDLKMPLLNGVESTKILQKEYPEIKVIAVTSYDGKSFITNMIDVGASSYLLKNTSPKIVVHTINEVFAKGFYYDERVLKIIHENLLSAKSKRIKSDLDNNLLTKREKEILELICNQYTTNEIAEKLLSSRHTHLSQVPAKRDTAEQVTEQKVVKKMVRKGSDND